MSSFLLHVGSKVLAFIRYTKTTEASEFELFGVVFLNYGNEIADILNESHPNL